ncbi:protein of unknown function [Pseudomonas mediterranea]
MASGCGCGGGNGGSGGCGSSAKAAPVADVAPVGAVQFEPVAVEEAPPQLIASSEQEWPIISVNGVAITPQAMAQELQYHPAQSREDAVYQAARALVIRELLQQRIAELGLSLQVGAGENEEEAATRLLLEREVQVPQCDEATCLRYYESNRARFHSAPLLAVRHILLECAPDDAEGRSLAHVQAGLLLEDSTRPRAASPSWPRSIRLVRPRSRADRWGRSARARPCLSWSGSCLPCRRDCAANRWRVATAGT